MAYIDASTGEIVIRIVYAGLPKSGKTEIMQRISESLYGKKGGKKLYSPYEAMGRTLYFDWLSYYEDRGDNIKLVYQIISVPGQETFSKRSDAILKDADAVVFVIGSRKSELLSAKRFYSKMTDYLNQHSNSHSVGILIQANKRDLKAESTLENIKIILNIDFNTIVYPSIATTGEGVIEGFKVAKDLAYERIVNLKSANLLETKPSVVSSGVELLKHLRGLEGLSDKPLMELDVASGSEALNNNQKDIYQLADVLKSVKSINNKAQVRDIGMLLPDSTVLPGLVWHSISGRIILYEVTNLEFKTYTDLNGDLYAERSDFSMCSRKNHVYNQENIARAALIGCIAKMETCKSFYATSRCFTIVKESDSKFRLWEIVKKEKRFDNVLIETFKSNEPVKIAVLMLEVFSFMVEAKKNATSINDEFKISLDSVCLINGKPVFLHFLPESLTVNFPATISKIETVYMFNMLIKPLIYSSLKEKTNLIPKIVRVFEEMMSSKKDKVFLIELLIASIINIKAPQ